MPNTTTNLGLKKPLITEEYDIAIVTNDNADLLDADIGTKLYTENNYILDDESLTSSIDKLDIALKDANDLIGDKQDELVSGTSIKTIEGIDILGSGNIALETPLWVALSDEATALTIGTSKLTIRMPFACKLTSELPRASVNTVSSSGIVTVDINKSGATILTNKLTIDVSEKTSTTATTPCSLVNTPTTFTDDEEVTFDIDVAGTGAKGLKVILYVERV
jgi:hypothetical protein